MSAASWEESSVAIMVCCTAFCKRLTNVTWSNPRKVISSGIIADGESVVYIFDASGDAAVPLEGKATRKDKPCTWPVAVSCSLQIKVEKDEMNRG